MEQGNNNLERKINIKKIMLSKINQIFVFDNSASNIDEAAKKLNNGAKLIEFYPKLSDKINIEQGFQLRQLCSMFDSLLIVKYRLDIAKIINADGILLDKNAININHIDKLLDNDCYIGYILDKNEDLNELNQRIDYVKTSSKCSNFGTNYNVKVFHCQKL